MTLGLDPQQLASAAMELLKNHWTLAAIPVANEALKEAGKSLFHLIQGAFTSKAAAGALEEAAENPTDANKAKALQIQIEGAIETNLEFRESLRKLIASLPEKATSPVTQTSTQTGLKNASTQTKGDSNKISTKIS